MDILKAGAKQNELPAVSEKGQLQQGRHVAKQCMG